MVIIDAHMHLGSIPDGKKKWGNFREYKIISKKLGIEKYCVVPIGLPKNFTDKSTPDNDSVLKEAEKNKLIIPVYWFNVFDLPKEISEKYQAIKLHSDIGKVNISDKKVEKFVNKINLPVFVHTNEGKEYTNLGEVSNLAKKVDVPVIAVHSGSVTGTFFKLNNYDFPKNVYFETSGIQYSIILQKIYERFGAKKIIFGSDYPFGDPRVSLAMIDTLEASKKDYKLMTEGNIRSIFQLK
ncbi:MAG: amidohydrolase family protein [Nanoarchaeota archaeon]|nr:amidohydrolase family protein [Nanoarchaeota archaeon]MBU4116429.1 amidohydrolase family protein [Nanoarchaeota archaeon]